MGGGYGAPRAARRLEGRFIRRRGSYSLDESPCQSSGSPARGAARTGAINLKGSSSDPERTWPCLCRVDALVACKRWQDLRVFSQKLRKNPDHISPPVEAGRATKAKKWGVVARRLAADM